MKFKRSARLPAYSNGASLERKTVEGASVALLITPNEKDFLTDFLSKRI